MIAPSAGKRTPITKVVPGLQLNARIASDPQGQARFLLRLPNNWNGRLVVAGASGTRSEFNGDFAWSDYVVQKGYAYASQNKGVLNLQDSPRRRPRIHWRAGSTRLPPTFVHFFDNDPGQPFTRWADFMVKAAELARDGVKAAYGPPPRFTYAVGTSNGGYQVRRAVEIAPKLFDGGVDWEGTFVDEHAPNILTDLPPAILNFPQYASGISSPSTAQRYAEHPGRGLSARHRRRGHGVTVAVGSLQQAFWEVTQCQWQKRLDPSYDTYGQSPGSTGTYNYVSRLSISDVGAQLAAFATTGDIQRPLITVAGTMDALLPIDHHARAYARKVAAVAESQDRGQGGGNDKHQPAYRLYEVQNGNHIETFPRHVHDAARTDRAARAARLRSACSAGRARRGATARSVYPARRPNRRYTCTAGTLRKAIRALKARGPAQRVQSVGACRSPANSKTSPLRTAGETPMVPARRVFRRGNGPITDLRGYRPLFRRRLSARGGVS